MGVLSPDARSFTKRYNKERSFCLGRVRPTIPTAVSGSSAWVGNIDATRLKSLMEPKAAKRPVKNHHHCVGSSEAAQQSVPFSWEMRLTQALAAVLVICDDST